MAMNLKRVLDGNEGQSELSSILSGAKNAIHADILAKQSKADMGALQGQLSRIFYPIGSTAISSDYYNRRLSESTEERLVEIFNSFNFESNKVGAYSTKTAMSPNTLRASMQSADNALRAALKQLEKFEPLADKNKIESVVEQIKNLVKQGQEILDTAQIEYQFNRQERIVGDDFQKASVIVNQLAAFSKALSIPDFVSPQDAGILFEEALALTNFVDDSSNAFISEALRDMATKTTQFGSEAIARGGSGPISYTVSSSLFKKAEEAKAKGFKIQKGNASFTYSYNPSAAKQGKMDVQLNYNSDSKEDYRVSAKRWSRGFGDLGETSIDAGITRMSDQTVAEAYKFAVLTPHKDWLNNETPKYLAAQNAHDFAVLALKADIAMGLSQGKTASGAGYANVLIVDTGSSIKVRDLASIVLDEKQKLSRYNAGSIETSAESIYKTMANLNHGRTQSYLGMMTSTLNKMKVTMNLSFAK